MVGRIFFPFLPGLLRLVGKTGIFGAEFQARDVSKRSPYFKLDVNMLVVGSAMR